MQNPQEIKRFTQNFNALGNPPSLPVAAWFAVVPMAMRLGYLAPVLGFTLLPLAVGASLALTTARRSTRFGAPLGPSFACRITTSCRGT
jgi:hypothetical protein